MLGHNEHMHINWSEKNCILRIILFNLSTSYHSVKSSGELLWKYQTLGTLKLLSLFAAWLFWTFHTKSHNMKALVILYYSWLPFLPLTLLFIWKTFTFVGLWSIFVRKKSSQITHANHMTITTSGQIWSWPDYHNTKENVNIKLLYLCLFTFYSVHANESTWLLL